ncbi:hypothetical protein [Shewanella sp. YIC-542]|uniref:hypothetical protein n=1 Tax=Shewanella mytili TaxID=3377111 RepID=UPI00398E7F39
MRFLKRILTGIGSFIEYITCKPVFYIIILPFFLFTLFVYLYIRPTPGAHNIKDLETPYSLRISHYAALNQKGLCKTYKNFVNDYVIYRQSERMKRFPYDKNIQYYMKRKLSHKSQSLLNNSSYGYLFRNAKEAFDTVKVRHSDVGNDYYTKQFIASNVTDKDRFFLDVMTSGSTYGGKYQPEIFSTIEYSRCTRLEKQFGLIDNLIYKVEKKYHELMYKFKGWLNISQ